MKGRMMYTGDDLPDATLGEPDWWRCEAIARHHGRTFYFASRCLPRAQRRAILAAYAYCRIADDIVDAAGETGADNALTDLAAWEDEITHPVHPVAVAFAIARKQFAIPSKPVHDLLAGIRMDVTTNRYASWVDLRSYCYLVAGTVGLMVAPILGCKDDQALEHAAELGIAMQLTNILRDIGEDATRNRLYLPQDEIEMFGCTVESILAGQPGPAFPMLLDYQIVRARALYAQARLGIPALDASGRFTTLVASDLYARILTEIEANRYDVFGTRAHCSTKRKLLALPAISARFLGQSLISRQLA